VVIGNRIRRIGRRILAMVVASGVGAGSVVALAPTPAPTEPSEVSAGQSAVSADQLRDWDFLVGHWTVRHHVLKARLAGSKEWLDFGGTLVNWPTMGGQGNVGDNVMERPGGTIRGVGIRAYDPQSGLWSVWWLDARNPVIDPPLKGSFKDGIGTFLADDSLHGRPIKVRVVWSRITATSAHWEQAFSPDGVSTWETNWTSDFTRSSHD